MCREVHDGAVVKTQRFHCWGPGFASWSENEDPTGHAVWHHSPKYMYMSSKLSNLLVTDIYSSLFLFGHEPYRILVIWPGTKPEPLQWKHKALTAREVPNLVFIYVSLWLLLFILYHLFCLFALIHHQPYKNVSPIDLTNILKTPTFGVITLLYFLLL